MSVCVYVYLGMIVPYKNPPIADMNKHLLTSLSALVRPLIHSFVIEGSRRNDIGRAIVIPIYGYTNYCCFLTAEQLFNCSACSVGMIYARIYLTAVIKQRQRMYVLVYHVTFVVCIYLYVLRG